MVKTSSGKRKVGDKKIAVVVSKFNGFITRNLLSACLEELDRLAILKKNITVVWVPGSFDMPVVALKIAQKKNIHAVICLGAVIRGETYHFEIVSQGAAYGIVQASLLTGKPVIFGVLTTDTVDQAYKRSDKKGENKGRDAARSAVEMVELVSRI